MALAGVLPGTRIGWGIGCIMLSTLGWSLSGVFVRALPGLEAWTMNAYRAGCTSAILLAYLAVRYRSDLGRHLWPAEPHALLIVGTVFAGGSTLYLLALTMASVASVACLGATAPLFAAGLAWLAMSERTSGAMLVAALAAIVGVFLIMGAEDAAFSTGLAGTLVALLVAFCFACQTVALRRYRNIEMIPGIVLGGLMAASAVLLIEGVPLLAWREIWILALMALLQLSIPLILYAEGAKHVSAVAMSLIAMGDVVLNPLWAWIGFGEVPPEGTIWGAMLILGAIVVATLVENRRVRTGI